jgi:ParB/RepB/Spo0J family partition protein
MSKEIMDIPLDQVLEDQPVFQRNRQDQGNLQLAASIERHGQYQEILVVREGRRYRIVDGNHRFQAHRILNKETIRARVLDHASVADAVTVNSYHHALDKISILRAVEKLLEENPGAEGKEIGFELNLSDSEACKYIRIARAIPVIRQKVTDAKKDVNKISFSVARELAYQDEEQQYCLLEEVLKRQKHLNRQLKREEFKQLVEDSQDHSASSVQLKAMAERFSNAMGIGVSVKWWRAKRGINRIVFEMLSLKDGEQMLRLFEELLDKQLFPIRMQKGSSE